MSAAPAPGAGIAPERGEDDAQRLTRLRDERDFLLASLDDLEREHAAGDLDDSEFARLRGTYVARAAAALREIAALEERAVAPTAPPVAPGALRRLRRFLGRRRTRRVLGVVGLVCVLGIVGITAAHFAGVRLPGETATGSISLPGGTSVDTELGQAASLDAAGKYTAAIGVYDTILRHDPRQPEALTYRGWLLRLTGIAGHAKALVLAGDVQLAAAVRVAPQDATARALDGVALFEDEGRPVAALAMFRAALVDHPPAGLLRLAGRTMAAAFVAQHAPLPPALRVYRPRP